MTKAKKTIERSIVDSIDARLVAQEFGSANIKRFNALRNDIATSQLTRAFFAACNVDSELAMRKVNATNMFDMYSVLSMNQLAKFLTSERATFRDIEENLHSVILTMVAFGKNAIEFTQRDFECILQRDLKVSAHIEQHIVRRASAYSTEKRQSTKCMNVLRELNLIKSVSRDAYKVDTDSACYKAIEAKLAKLA